MTVLKPLVRMLLRMFYRVEVRGLEQARAAGPRTLIVANHTSRLDALLLWAFLPGPLTFAVNTQVAKAWWMRPLFALVPLVPIDPTNPMSLKSLIRNLRRDRSTVIFPEGRLTRTGSLMKVYPGPGMVADRAEAPVLPVHIEGAQYTPFSRLGDQVRRRWFPRIRLTVLAPRRFEVEPEAVGRRRRDAAGDQLAAIMRDMMFQGSDHRRTIPRAVLDARRVHGAAHVVLEDSERRPLSYAALLRRAFALGGAMARASEPGERVGLLLPGATNTVAALLGLQLHGRVPTMLNYSLGPRVLCSCARTASLRTVYTSRAFVDAAGLQAVVDTLAEHVRVVYLEDLRQRMGLGARVRAALCARFPEIGYRYGASAAQAHDPALVLFTSGSEGDPKGVVLSHANLLANQAQLATGFDFNARDVVLNALPLFHAFGLTAATILPLVSGIRTFLYPNPLHYRVVPEMAYEANATILFGTNSFLSGYGRHADAYDFYSLRYVFAGAEKLQESTRTLWAEKFGLRILEGYGATETAPVVAANTPMACRPGSVGRLLPGIEAHLQPVPGITDGARLHVRGPNVMLGYLLSDRPGELVPPASEVGGGWYDTGDIAQLDADGFLHLRGRAKRFAKVGGEMVSLAVVEELAARVWPDGLHVALALPDPRKGEQVVLVSEHADANRRTLQQRAKADGLGELVVPRRVCNVRALPLLGSGKPDFNAVQDLVGKEAV